MALVDVITHFLEISTKSKKFWKKFLLLPEPAQK